MRCLYLAIAILTAEAVSAQPAGGLKLRGFHSAAASLTLSPGRSAGGRRHVLVQFRQQPSAEELARVAGRSGKVVQYVPDSAYVISTPEWTGAGDAAVAWSGALKPQAKVSAALAHDDASVFALVEFYPDVAMDLARSVVLQSQLTIQENPDLTDHHLLVYGSPDAINTLAQWDEVAYIFPASDDLVAGVPVNACAGALTDQGQIGQSVAMVGGWAAPGQGANLYYAFRNTPDSLPADSVQAEIVRAFNVWAQSAKLTFTQTNDPNQARTLAVLFGSGNHGDPYPFQPSGPVLAHTFYPYPTNAEPLAGDLHFNTDENWHVGADVDLFSVALHEAGHALGLGHSDQPGAVMYPYYRRQTALTQEDIGAILTLYAAQDGTAPAAAPLTLSLQNPGSNTTAASVALAGATLGGTGTVQVTWATDSGATGVAAGSGTWTVAAVPLVLGANTITVTATDSRQATATQVVTVTRTAAAPPAPAAPSTPVLHIVFPTASGSYTAAGGTVSISGTAADASGIAKVMWSASNGAGGQAAGTQSWSTGQITLSAGTTAVMITAFAQSGKSASQVVQITYTPAASAPSAPTQPAAPATPATPPAAPPVTPPAPPQAPSNDTTPPTLAILTPVSTSVSTSSATILVTGTASDNVGVTSVAWSTSNGDSGTATGTTNWSMSVPLLVGSTTITIRAYDQAGNSSWRSLVVARH